MINTSAWAGFDSTKPACFCDFCIAKAKARRIDPDRARQGFIELQKFVAAAHKQQHPVDGYYVTLWRLMLRYPELLAWETLWTDSLHGTYAAIYEHVKSIKPSLQVGWHIYHDNSFSPMYRAQQDLAVIAPHSDFLKMVLYHNCAGERMANYIDNVGSSIYGDVPKQELLDFHYRVLNYEERSLDQIPYTGFQRITSTGRPSVRVTDCWTQRRSCGRVSMWTFLRRKITASVRLSEHRRQLKLHFAVAPTASLCHETTPRYNWPT